MGLGGQWSAAVRLASGQSSASCQSEHTSSFRVKGVWRSWRRPFVEAWCCRLVRRLVSCERRSVVLETAVIDCELVELCGDLPAVSWPFHIWYRRSCCDGSSGNRATVTTAVVWWSWPPEYRIVGGLSFWLVWPLTTAVVSARWSSDSTCDRAEVTFVFLCGQRGSRVIYSWLFDYECELYFSLKCTYLRFYAAVSCLFGTAHAVHYYNYRLSIDTVTSREARPRQKPPLVVIEITEKFHDSNLKTMQTVTEGRLSELFCVVLCTEAVHSHGSLILEIYLPSVLWHCWLGHLTCKNLSPIWPYNVFGGMLNVAQSINQSISEHITRNKQKINSEDSIQIDNFDCSTYYEYELL